MDDNTLAFLMWFSGVLVLSFLCGVRNKVWPHKKDDVDCIIIFLWPLTLLIVYPLGYVVFKIYDFGGYIGSLAKERINDIINNSSN